MIDFDYCFNKLTGNKPFAWQRELFVRLTRGAFPSECDIPTGLGKTSIIAIWLLALANDLTRQVSERTIPLRLVYVVDRRVIVDQATSAAEEIVKNLKELSESDDRLKNVYNALRRAALSQDDVVVALSTLRGEHADNREWFLDPSRPAIIVGTIDMIGSRLLFSAYGGVGASYKALQAGLMGQDSLIAVDEAHLSPAFKQTLRAIRQTFKRKSPIKPFEVISLSATPAGDEEGELERFTLEEDAPEDLTNEVTASRLNAEKKIEWREYAISDAAKDEKNELGKKKTPDDFQADEMARAAARYKDLPVSILIFGRTVTLVKKVFDRLKRVEQIDDAQILLMVGGMRGYERDNLVKVNEVFKQFSPYRERGKQERAYFLVATSCAEVGVDLDADFAVCDLVAADSFIQRLGRVNRLGNFKKFVQSDLSEEQRRRLLEITNGEDSPIVTVVFNQELNEQKPEAIATFHTLINQANGDGLSASPLALRRIKFDVDLCYPPKPVCPPLDSARLDDWSMTSLKQNKFPRPLVSYWLRGVTENTTAETALCWRAELSLSNNRGLLETMMKSIRVNRRECARESTTRAVKTILAINEKYSESLAVLIDSTNNYTCLKISELVSSEKSKQEDKARELYEKLMFATVVLPCEVGGLERGIAVEDSEKLQPIEDVLDEVKLRKTATGDFESEWLRVLLVETEAETTARYIGSDNINDETFSDFKTALREISRRENKRSFVQIELTEATAEEGEADDETKTNRQTLVYFVASKSPTRCLPSEGEGNNETASVSFLREVTLASHNTRVGEYAKQLAEKLKLDERLSEALKIAGEWHDKGKNREDWQRYVIGNNSYPTTVLAKSGGKRFKSKRIGYRHEFGSLIEADADEYLKQHPARDLILHLIATHHGYARPHFPERAFDKDNPMALNREIAEAAMTRFARLQTKYGWWQLAYLEAILKTADALASCAEARGEV